MTKGFVCHKCSTPEVPVIQTFTLTNAVRRRRKCPSCGHTFHTYEIADSMIPTDETFDYLFRKAPAQ